MTLLKVFLSIVALGLSSAAAGQTTGAQATDAIQPSDAAQIANAAATCWSAVAGGSFDPKKIEAVGWRSATGTDAKGTTIALPLGIYGRSGSNALIMGHGTGNDRSMCAVVARVRTLDEIKAALPTIKQALVAVDPKVKAAIQGGGVVFIALPRLAMLEATGTKEKPGVRIVVGYQTAGKK